MMALYYDRRGTLAVREIVRATAATVRDDRVKNDFLSGMSHELRTPLTAILGYTELLLEEHDEVPGVVETLPLVKGSATELLYLVNGLLDLAKLEAGRLELASERVQIGTVVSGCHATELLDGGLLEVEVYADPIRLKQVVDLLFAVGRSTTGRLSVRLGRDAGMVTVEVDASVQEAELDPAAAGWTGIELPLARALADALGGQLTFVREPHSALRLHVPEPA